MPVPCRKVLLCCYGEKMPIPRKLFQLARGRTKSHSKNTDATQCTHTYVIDILNLLVPRHACPNATTPTPLDRASKYIGSRGWFSNSADDRLHSLDFYAEAGKLSTLETLGKKSCGISRALDGALAKGAVNVQYDAPLIIRSCLCVCICG